MANRASVIFYTVDARTLQNPDISPADSVSLPANIARFNRQGGRGGEIPDARIKELSDTQGGLDFLSRETGGFPIKNQNDLNMGLERVSPDQSYYLLGYEPDSDTFDPKASRINKIEIKVKREGVNVRYRSGFFGITDDQLAPKPGAAPQAMPLEQVLNSPFTATGIALRLNTIFGNGADGSYVTPLLNIDARDIKFTQAPDGTRRAVIDVIAMSFNAEGIPTEKFGKTLTLALKPDAYEKVLRTGVLCHFNFPVKAPGAYQYRIAVADKQAQTTGSATQFLEIPDLKKGRLTLSGIMLENFTSEQWRRLAGEIVKAADIKEPGKNARTDPMNDTSLRRFTRDTVLRYGFEVYNARREGAKKANLFTRLRVFKDGALVLDGQEMPLDMLELTDRLRVKAGGAMNLPRDMPTGSYILQILVTDGRGNNFRQIATQSMEFEIVG